MDRPAGASALQPLRGVTLFFGAHPINRVYSIQFQGAGAARATSSPSPTLICSRFCAGPRASTSTSPSAFPARYQDF
jgi:hypothetical protein